MSPEAAAAAVQEEVKNRVEQTKRQVDAKMMQGANELENAALTVLANPSPSAPGSPPGGKERKLEKKLEYVQFWRWRKWHIRNQSGMHYSGYRNMEQAKWQPVLMLKKSKKLQCRRFWHCSRS